MQELIKAAFLQDGSSFAADFGSYLRNHFGLGDSIVQVASCQTLAENLHSFDQFLHDRDAPCSANMTCLHNTSRQTKLF